MYGSVFTFVFQIFLFAFAFLPFLMFHAILYKKIFTQIFFSPHKKFSTFVFVFFLFVCLFVLHFWMSHAILRIFFSLNTLPKTMLLFQIYQTCTSSPCWFYAILVFDWCDLTVLLPWTLQQNQVPRSRFCWCFFSCRERSNLHIRC